MLFGKLDHKNVTDSRKIWKKKSVLYLGQGFLQRKCHFE